MTPQAEVLICGAGIAGVALAYELAVRRGRRGIVLVDRDEPLALTSDKSTECYRNWWPGPDGAMIALMNRSIDRLEEFARATGNRFRLNRRGYVYASADPARAALFARAAEEASRQGAGPLRTSGYQPAAAEGFEDALAGADLLRDPAEIRRYFPYLAPGVVAALHVRRAGWFSSTELGAFLLEQARAHGAELLRAEVSAVRAAGGRVQAAELADGRVIEAGAFVNAAGPLVNDVARLCGERLPVYCERHAKLAFRDRLNMVPRDAPLLIWADPQTLPWSEDERAWLAESDETRALTGLLPAGAHLRPEGGAGSQVLLMLWDYEGKRVAPIWPPAFDPLFAEVVLGGLSTMLPGLRAYAGNMPRPVLDGGYYTRTPENRPLIGPLGMQGAYVLGALSGYGLMAAYAAAELLAAHLCGDALPAYAPAFAPARYEDRAYRARLAAWDDSGQL